MPEPRNQLIEELRRDLDDVHWQVRHHELGWIVSVGDGVAHVRGCPSVRYGELLQREMV